MADQLDNRPVFTVVLGCAGAGKTAWKRENWDRLPTRYFDHNSFAGGVGDWDTESAKARARQVVGQEIDKAMEAGLDFGVESTCPGGPGRELVERVKRAGYRVEAVYIGTESPEINVERVEHRVASRTGHRADVEKLPEDHAVSRGLSNVEAALAVPVERGPSGGEGGAGGNPGSRRTRCYGRSVVPSGGVRGIARRRAPFRCPPGRFSRGALRCYAGSRTPSIDRCLILRSSSRTCRLSSCLTGASTCTVTTTTSGRWKPARGST